MTENITHDGTDYQIAKEHLRSAIHLHYGHDDVDGADNELSKLNDITGIHFHEQEVCHFRVLHNTAIQVLENMSRNRPSQDAIPTTCGILTGVGECGVEGEFDDADETLTNYLLEDECATIEEDEKSPASESETTFTVKREYIVDALSERNDFTEIDEALLSKSEKDKRVHDVIKSVINEIADESMPRALDTYKDWHEAGFAMVWSIYEDTSEDTAIEDWPLDFTAPYGAPDGEHKVGHNAYGYGIATSVTHARIIEGKFEPVSTERAVLEAVATSYGKDSEAVRSGKQGLDYLFIEEFLWDDEAEMLVVHTGS